MCALTLLCVSVQVRAAPPPASNCVLQVHCDVNAAISLLPLTLKLNVTLDRFIVKLKWDLVTQSHSNVKTFQTVAEDVISATVLYE